MSNYISDATVKRALEASLFCGSWTLVILLAGYPCSWGTWSVFYASFLVFLVSFIMRLRSCGWRSLFAPEKSWCLIFDVLWVAAFIGAVLGGVELKSIISEAAVIILALGLMFKAITTRE